MAATDRLTGVNIGVLHPGEMGSAVAAVLARRQHDVRYASAGRSADTIARAAADGLTDSLTPQALAEHADVLLSICPPHAALDVAKQVAGFRGIYVDANAISPSTAKAAAAVTEADFVDGGIIGGPPRNAGTTRLVLSGSSASTVAELFESTELEPVVISDQVGDASAVKMLYAAWTKGTTAMLLAIRAAARESGVEDALLAEWGRSQPDLIKRSDGAAHAAAGKGWRWTAEMEEIAATLAACGLPAGFHQAAAEVFAKSPRGAADLDAILAAIRA